MGWRHIHVRCQPAQPGQEIAMAWLADAGCSMFQDDRDGLDAFAMEQDLDFALLAEIKADLGPLGLQEWRESEVEEENWNARWESDYPEVSIESAIRIRAPFHPEQGEGSFDHTIVLQPRMAFGTGHHGTTYGLLSEMVGMSWEGMKVLDMGCGSGVLGIYAAMRGASEVLFVDIDPWSVRNTRENLTLNGLDEGPAHEVREGGADVLQAADHGRFDVVIANINRNILLHDMSAYAKAMKPSGTLMLSGFMQPDVVPLEVEAERYQLKRTKLRMEVEWRILVMKH